MEETDAAFLARIKNGFESCSISEAPSDFRRLIELAGHSILAEPTDGMIDAAASEIWDQTEARHSGLSFEAAPDDLIAKIHTRAIAKAALQAAHSVGQRVEPQYDRYMEEIDAWDAVEAWFEALANDLGDMVQHFGHLTDWSDDGGGRCRVFWFRDRPYAVAVAGRDSANFTCLFRWSVPMVEGKGIRRVVHHKRETTYDVIQEDVELQCLEPIPEGTKLTIYRADKGRKWWARPDEEFSADRFGLIP